MVDDLSPLLCTLGGYPKYVVWCNIVSSHARYTYTHVGVCVSMSCSENIFFVIGTSRYATYHKHVYHITSRLCSFPFTCVLCVFLLSNLMCGEKCASRPRVVACVKFRYIVRSVETRQVLVNTLFEVLKLDRLNTDQLWRCSPVFTTTQTKQLRKVFGSWFPCPFHRELDKSYFGSESKVCGRSWQTTWTGS